MPPHEGDQNRGESPERDLPGQSYGITYDEASMEQSHSFLMALQELKNLRPQLYSAAEYCESSYLYSNQKQAVLENLKDYSVKALVNAVDHLGTVAFKLNDLMTQQATEVASADIRAGSLTQRLRSCQEHSDREGLKQQSLAKSTQANHKHYVLPEATEELKGEYDQDVLEISREIFDFEQVHSQAQGVDGSGSSRNLAWHFAVNRSPMKTSSSSSIREGSSSRSMSAEQVRVEERSKSEEKLFSSDRPPKTGRTSGRSKSTEKRPLARVSSSNALPVQQLISLDSDRDSQPPSRSKSLLRSLLSRGRSVPSPSCIPSLD